MADIIQIRRDTVANWTASNPVLASGEMGYESDTNKFKFGDGSTAWTSLTYNSIYSFNGRTGAVVPATNDYTWAQINKSTSNIADITTKSHTALTDIGSNTHAQIDTFISSKGANSGLATLDSGGKVPYSELPSSVMSYLGTWSAATNTPTLADGTGDAGDVYVCNAAGTLNLGSGSLTFAIGDWCIYNGTIWQKSLNSNAVSSVNGYTGTIVLVKSDIGLANVTNDAQLKIASNLSDLNNTTTAKTNLSLNNVENTALSTWVGTSNITTLGTITNGTWHGTGIANAYLANSGILASTAANGFQISAVSLGGTFALTTPQDLRTTASPTFVGMTLTGNLGMGSNTISAGYGSFVQTVNQNSTYGLNVQQNASTLQDGSANTGTDYTVTTQYVATKFTASGALTMGSFAVRIKVSALPTNYTDYYRGSIYSDNAGVPGTLLVTGNYQRIGTLTTSYVVYNMGTQYTMVNGTNYWFVLYYNNAPVGGSIVLDSTAGTSLGATSPDGTTWTATNSALYYKIYGLTAIGVQGASTNSYGVQGNSTNNYGVYGNSTNSYGVYGNSTNSIGVQGNSTNNYGVYGNSTNFIGVQGASTNSYGVQGASTNYIGVYGNSTNSIGVQGNSTNSIGGIFYIGGTLTQNNPSNTVLIRRYSSGTYNVTGNVLQITDNPTTSGTISGALISGQIDSTERFRIDPRVVDGASAVLSFIDSKNALATSGAKLFSLRNSGTEKFYVDYSGDGYFAGNVGIGTASPNANAALDVTSTTKAFMPPRMTTTQKNAIASPTSGMVVYDSTLNKLCVYGASSWETITSV